MAEAQEQWDKGAKSQCPPEAVAEPLRDGGNGFYWFGLKRHFDALASHQLQALFGPLLEPRAPWPFVIHIETTGYFWLYLAVRFMLRCQAL